MGDICWSGCLCIGQDGQLILEEGPGVVYVEQCVILWLSRYIVVRLRKRRAGVLAR